MGSLPSPSPPPPPSPPSSAEYRMYMAICGRTPSSHTKFCNWIESYNPWDNSWNCVGPIPGIPERHVLRGFAMVAVADSIYIVGGRLCYRGEEDGAEEVNLAVLATVRRYSVTTRAWSECAALGTPRFDFACTVCDGKIYAAGGQISVASGRGVSSAEVYYPAEDAWGPLPGMRTVRYKCVGVTWEGKVYVVGGFAEGGDSDGRTVTFAAERSSAEAFDVSRGEWELMPRMWRLDVPPNQIVAVDGKLYSSGDCLNPWKGHVESYDGKLNIWNSVDGSRRRSFFFSSSSASSSGSPVTNEATQRIYLTMAPVGTQLYFLAGYRLEGEDHRSVSVVHAFDTSAGQGEEAWMCMEPTEEEGEKELCGHCCVIQL
ncbi:hypothetical protein H6P81_005616 [Aristolochia fimbriata]|uniref:Uncharacterized protein n=1 Tax=Aristolochia fimbriata TaxID=158543 RepID=A0AAV7EYI9_ARIFI|nr:hypothetical protein H6P81_005616 [Aristolochia fimbriata]